MCVHREQLIGVAEQGLYIAIQFPKDDPPGWYWGKPLAHEKTARKDGNPQGWFWVNFTEEGLEYDPNDDVKVVVNTISVNSYAKVWAMVAPKAFKPQAAAPE